jgi:redox-sensitive bicupin YhaK (pirin superfamily)
MNSRQVSKIIEPEYVMEGAGVRLRRSIATRILNYVDPFLLFDHFGSDNPQDYLAGFPMHPHRGIETVTYMLAGIVHHKDTLGNEGSLTAGDVQWMTSGSGIMHEEMPGPVEGQMDGFQLWVNLPASLKMSRPRYQEIPSEAIPEVHLEGGVKVRVIAGKLEGVSGPVTEIAADPSYLDVTIPPGGGFTHLISRGHNAVAYIFQGEGEIGAGGKNRGTLLKSTNLAVLGDGEYATVNTREKPVRFLLISGKPLNEPIARYGPFVMNTKEEIALALEDLKKGTFVKD